MPNSLIINCENVTLASVLKTYRILFAFEVNVKEYNFVVGCAANRVNLICFILHSIEAPLNYLLSVHVLLCKI